MRSMGGGNIGPIRPISFAGITLVELIISVAILSLIAAAAAALLSTALQTQAYAEQRQNLNREAFQIMTRITEGLRKTSHVMVPNSHSANRPLLIFSANINQDGDVYQSNSLFPRFDEDMDEDMTNDSLPGVATIDDNGDLLTDLLLDTDDDEDLALNEDRWDGLDNDGDGTIDEDVGNDASADNKAGVGVIDDDWDATIDEGSTQDDDEDAATQEDWFDPIIYTYSSGSNTLTEKIVATNTTTTLSTQVTAFSAVYEQPDANGGPRLLITLTLTDTANESVTFSEYVFPRNTLQKCGKRVR
ncbi:MAG: hypothetical protein HYV26_07625 [Candidatus Hydrogenedentes bacterium]|nr:hypothetical protein [Candidatus Hydrogenedentota bacterium]